MKKAIINCRVFIAGKCIDELVMIMQDGIITAGKKYDYPSGTFLIGLKTLIA